MKVLVTGATGGNLARELWRRGDDVRALVRPGSNRLTIENTGIIPVEGDILDRQSVDRAVQGCEAVFHVAAAYTFWSRDTAGISRTNVAGTCLKRHVNRGYPERSTPARSGPLGSLKTVLRMKKLLWT